MNFPSDKNPSCSEKDVLCPCPGTPEISFAVWLLTEHRYPSTYIRLERGGQEVRKRGRGREVQMDTLLLFSLSVCVYSVCHHHYSITQTEIKNMVPALQYCNTPTLPWKTGNNDTPGREIDTPGLLRDAAVIEGKLRKATKELLAEAERGRFWLWLRKRQRNWGKTT